MSDQIRLYQPLAASGARYCELVNDLDAIVWEVDPTTWQFTFINQRAEEILGYPIARWLSEPNFWVNLVHPEDRAQAVEFCRSATAEGRDHEFEYRALAADGRVVWLRDIVRVVCDNGQVTGLRGLMVDITEHKQAEAELQRQKSYLESLMQYNPLAIAMLDMDHRLVLCNPAFERLFQYSQAEARGKDLDDLVTSQETAAEAKAWTKAVLVGGAIQQIARRRRKDGTVLDVEVFGVPVVVEGKQIGVFALYHDITERQRAAAALFASEDKFAKAFRSSPYPITISTLRDGRYLEVNESFLRATGYRREEVIGQTTLELDIWARPEERARMFQMLQDQGSVRNLECHFRLKSDEVRVVLLSAEFIDLGGELCVLAIVNDITKRKQAKAERQAIFDIIQGVSVTANLNELLRLIHQSLKQVIYAENFFVALQDPHTGLFHKPYFVDQYDTVSPPQRMGKSCTAYVFRTGRPVLITEDIFNQLVEQGEVELVGTPSPCWLGVPLKTPSETIGVMVVQHYEDEHAYTERDVEFLASVGSQVALAIERKRAEEALRQAEQKYRSIFENAVEGIFQTTPDGHYLSVNPALARMYGYHSPEELMTRVKDIGRQVYVDPNRRTEFKRLMEERGVVQDFEYQVYRKDGSQIWLSESARAIRDASGTILYYEGTVEDITERKRLEAQLLQAQKMESIGTLAGGIAHDFNNLLQGILGYTSLTLQVVDPQSEPHRYLRTILESAERAANLTTQMLTFSRHKEPRVEPIAINRLVEESLWMLRHMIPTTIEIRTRLEPELWTVEADATQIQQVLVNLCVNARDAMPGGGMLTLETENYVISELEAEHRVGVVAGRYILITVSDTGVGMMAAVRERIFEPFFTTKGVGEGTGLGLAVAYGIVRSHKGWINVYSEPGQGAVFRIYLPATEKEVATRERAAQAISGGRETILVVDDEPVVLKLACDILASYGYRTLTAQDGEEAIQVFQNQMADIDLVLLDLTMPKLNGLEAARRLRALNPAIRVIASSGYSAQTRDILNGEVQAFVPKPYGPKDLAGTVRAVLDGSENSRFAKKSGLPVEKVIY